MEQSTAKEAIEKRPGIFVVGSPGVGKRTILSRLLSVDFEDTPDTSSEVLIQGWTVDTKYYTADVTVWMAHLHDDLSSSSLPDFSEFAAIVMLSSLAALKKWVAHTDIQNSDILLCIGNKVDLVPGHPAHDEYKRRLARLKDPFASSEADSFEYGIFESEGSSLLSNDEPSCDIKRSCLEWCMEHNIEYVEACASNVDFDQCLSVDGDSQGVERIFSALSAHMWPGMVLKSGNRILAPTLPERQDSSEDDSDYEAEYEVLSGGSAGIWDDAEDVWVSAVPPNTSVESTDLKCLSEAERAEPSALTSSELRENDGELEGKEFEAEYGDDPNTGAHLELEDLEHLMSEIANMRSNSRLMPDFQRRDRAAKLAMRMAALFGDCSGDEGHE
ncbi:GTP-binding protein yptV3 [Bienertia sinuspersici]